MMRSESTVVPPVTPDRSPPASRITGAGFAGDRRFIDDRGAFDHVAVARDNLVFLTITLSPGLRLIDDTVSVDPSTRSRKADVSTRVLRNVSACRLAALLSDRRGEVGEKHGQKQPASSAMK